MNQIFSPCLFSYVRHDVINSLSLPRKYEMGFEIYSNREGIERERERIDRVVESSGKAKINDKLGLCERQKQ